MNLWDLRTLIWYLVPVPWVGKVTRPSFLVGSGAGIWSRSIPSGASSKCWCCCWRFPEDVIFSMHWISMFWAYSSSSNYTALPTSSPSSGTTFALLYSLIWMSNVSSWNHNQTFFSSTGHSPHPLCTFYLIFFFRWGQGEVIVFTQGRVRTVWKKPRSNSTADSMNSLTSCFHLEIPNLRTLPYVLLAQ